MHKLSLYTKLAWTNIKANYRLYVPYLIASIGMIMMFYIILLLAMDPGMNISQLSQALGSGSFVVGIFAVSFILYINSFLMKRRIKEFGLYNVLGMDKPQIAAIVFIETVISFFIASVGGIILGTVFAKLTQLLLLRMIQYAGNLSLNFNAEPILSTLGLFAVIYILAFLTTLKTIYQTKPVDLLSSSNAGEKAPKANWLMAIIGFIVLGAGYWLAQYVQSPNQALSMFFIAVALVMIGTFFLFTSCSVAILKVMQKNKKFYYQKNHFINVSGMMYRMKQNAKGLAQICILSCMVLVTISMTVSIYVNTENIIKDQFHRDVQIEAYTNSVEDAAVIQQQLAEKVQLSKTNEASFVRGQTLIDIHEIGLNNIDTSNTTYADVTVLPISFYNQQTNRNIVLNNGDIAVYCNQNGQISDSLTINGNNYHVQEELKTNLDVLDSGNQYLGSVSVFIYCNDPFALSNDIQNAQGNPTLMYCDYFDTDATNDEQVAFVNQLNENYFDDAQQSGTAECLYLNRLDTYSVIGGLLFVGVFLGTLFLIATVLIIYYKQVSEGYEDRHRYEILQQVGMSKQEVKKSINSQVLMVFFLPLAVAILHICFAFHIVYELMRAFGLVDTMLYLKYLVITVAIFAIVYVIVYFVTSKVYYHIVENKQSY